MYIPQLDFILDDPQFGYLLFLIYAFSLIGLNVKEQLYEFLSKTAIGIKNIYIMLLLGLGIIFNLPFFIVLFKQIGIEITIVRLPITILEFFLLYAMLIFDLGWFALFLIGFLLFFTLIFGLVSIIGHFVKPYGDIVSFIVVTIIMIKWYGKVIFILICRIILTPIDFIIISITVLTQEKLIKKYTSLCPYELF